VNFRAVLSKSNPTGPTSLPEMTIDILLTGFVVVAWTSLRVKSITLQEVAGVSLYPTSYFS
jgi:hypothetical protein